MTTTRRGVNSLTDTTGTNHHVPLPTGSVAGDWCIVAAVGNATTPSLGMPGTQLSQGTIGNTLYGVSKKQLDSTDISNGYLNVTTPSAQNLSAVIVGYSASGGFDAIGTVTIRTSTSTDTTALAVTSDGSQDILVFSLAKTNSATTVSDSPSTTLLANAIQSSGALPSAHVAVYTGTAANRTSTWNVSSGNGCGFQIAVLQPSASKPLLNVWDGSAMQQVTVEGVWDGSAIQPVTVEGEWDGTSIKPVAIT